MSMTESMINELYLAGKDCLWDYDFLQFDLRDGTSGGSFDVNRAMEAICKAAYHLLDMAAKNGHALAAFKLSKLCSDPNLWIVMVNEVGKEEKLMKQALEGMVEQAMKNPSLAYDAGFAYLYESRTEDIDKAERCFKAGAAANDASCIWQLGEIAKKRGRRIPAFHYYLKAAKLGQGMAMYEVGQCYEKGEGTPPDKSEAIRWYKLCVKSKYAAQSDAEARLKALTKK